MTCPSVRVTEDELTRIQHALNHAHRHYPLHDTRALVRELFTRMQVGESNETAIIAVLREERQWFQTSLEVAANRLDFCGNWFENACGDLQLAETAHKYAQRTREAFAPPQPPPNASPS